MSHRPELLELLLSPLETLDQFKVTVTQSPAGEGSAESQLPFFEANQDWRSTLIRALELTSFESRHFTTVEQAWMVEAQLLEENCQAFHPNLRKSIGQALYSALIPPNSKVKRLLNESIQIARSHGAQLLVQLKFEENTVQVTRLPDYPWELIHDGTGFLLHNEVGFSRYIAFPAVPPSLPAVDQVNVLLVSSSASDKALGFQPLPKRERSAIAETLKTSIREQRVRLEELSEPTLDGLAAYLTQQRDKEAPHLLHFDGHGLFGKQCTVCRAIHKGIKNQQCQNCNAGSLPEAQGYLLFEDECGDPDYVSASQLGALLQQTRQSDSIHQTGGVAALVLSACQSGMAIEGESVFQGTAQNLIYHGVPAVVAMQYSVTVKGAVAFAKQFYRSIGEKNSLAVAVSQGRTMMRVDENQWYRPVLYLRWRDNEGGQLFTTSKPDADTPRKSGNSQKIQVEPPHPTVIAGQNDSTSKKIVLLLSTLKSDQSQRREEFNKIKNALYRAKYRDEFISQNGSHIGASDLSQELSAVEPHIVDISGYEDGINSLVLESFSDKNTFKNPDKLIADVFKRHANSIECIILNRCYSKKQAEAIIQHIKFVVCISQELEDSKVIDFLDEFYFQIGSKQTIRYSYECGRERLERKGIEDDKLIPVLLDKYAEYAERRRKELEDKLISCDKAIEKDQNNLRLLQNRANFLIELGRSEEVDETYERASMLAPNNPEIKAEQGKALEQFGKHEEAVNAYDKALELKPEDYKIWWDRAQALVEGKKYDEAIESYEKAIVLEPPSPDSYVICRQYGFILEKLEQYQKSIALYKKATDIKPKYRASSYEKRQVYKKMHS